MSRVESSIRSPKGWDLLEHPPYSPTEAPTDYHVNRSVKNWQTGKFFDTFDELVADIKEWIASKNRNFFARGIDRLPAKWDAVLEVDGEYAPEWSIKDDLVTLFCYILDWNKNET